MGIAIFAAARMVQAVPAWLELHWPQWAGADTMVRPSGHQTRSLPRKPGTRQRAAGLAQRVLVSLANAARRSGSPLTERTPHHPGATKPLRVLRVIEPHQARNAAGRMVISGRMADVCAELDRLAAAESSCGFERR